MVVQQQLKLSIEESHNANDGNAKGCGEKHFVEHLFLLVSDLGLGQTIMICWCCLQARKVVKTDLLSEPNSINACAPGASSALGSEPKLRIQLSLHNHCSQRIQGTNS